MLNKIKVEGMTCNGCVANVKRIVESQEGVQKCLVSLEGYAEVEFDISKTNITNICAAIDKAGFSATV